MITNSKEILAPHHDSILRPTQRRSLCNRLCSSRIFQATALLGTGLLIYDLMSNGSSNAVVLAQRSLATISGGIALSWSAVAQVARQSFASSTQPSRDYFSNASVNSHISFEDDEEVLHNAGRRLLSTTTCNPGVVPMRDPILPITSLILKLMAKYLWCRLKMTKFWFSLEIIHKSSLLMVVLIVPLL